MNNDYLIKQLDKKDLQKQLDERLLGMVQLKTNSGKTENFSIVYKIDETSKINVIYLKKKRLRKNNL